MAKKDITEDLGDVDDEAVQGILTDLVARAKVLLGELEIFREHLRNIRQEQHVEVAHFRSTVQSELNMLERLRNKPEDQSTKSISHVAKSSNLPFLEYTWGMAKRSGELVALQKRIYYNSPMKSLSQAMHHVSLGINKRPSEKGSRNSAVNVDTVTNGGLLWTKVSLVTNTRLLYDLAKLGWDSGESEDDDEDLPPRDGDEDEIPLVKNAKELCFAAQSYRVRTRKPQVHMILPRIRVGETKQIDAILDQCRSAGATLFCGADLGPVPPLEEALPIMAPNPLSAFSTTLNIDCTILLALVSEFSHARVAKEPWFHSALKRQVEIEGNENLLPSLLYPALDGHPLVCTKEAAQRLREIVMTTGTSSEKARTAIMMGDDVDKSRAELIDEMQQWSTYPVSPHWQLPIKVIDQNDGDCQNNLSAVALEVTKDMTSINKSVFGYGWASGNTTITSNRVVVKQIENDLEKREDLDASVFPHMWLCPTARSLVGKEKRGTKKEGSVSAQRLPDPLRREEQRRNGLDVLSIREGHEVEDLRPDGYPCEEVLAAKDAASKARLQSNGSTKADSFESA